MTETTYPTPAIDLTQTANGSTATPAVDLTQLKSSASDRLVAERDKLTETLRSFTDELREMQTGSSSQGAATSLIGQAADRSDQILSYVESRDPQQLFGDVRRYASSHPVTFLAGAAVVGGILGRITRTAAAASREADLTGSAPVQSDVNAYANSSGQSASDPIAVVGV